MLETILSLSLLLGQVNPAPPPDEVPQEVTIVADEDAESQPVSLDGGTIARQTAAIGGIIAAIQLGMKLLSNTRMFKTQTRHNEELAEFELIRDQLATIKQVLENDHQIISLLISQRDQSDAGTRPSKSRRKQLPQEPANQLEIPLAEESQVKTEAHSVPRYPDPALLPQREGL